MPLAHKRGVVKKATTTFISPIPSPQQNTTLSLLRDYYPFEDPPDIMTYIVGRIWQKLLGSPGRRRGLVSSKQRDLWTHGTFARLSCAPSYKVDPVRALSGTITFRRRYRSPMWKTPRPLPRRPSTAMLFWIFSGRSTSVQHI